MAQAELPLAMGKPSTPTQTWMPLNLPLGIVLLRLPSRTQSGREGLG